jgi:hypothetical protein
MVPGVLFFQIMARFHVKVTLSLSLPLSLTFPAFSAFLLTGANCRDYLNFSKKD